MIHCCYGFPSLVFCSLFSLVLMIPLACFACIEITIWDDSNACLIDSWSALYHPAPNYADSNHPSHHRGTQSTPRPDATADRWVQTPVRQYTSTPVHQYASTPVRQYTSTPVRQYTSTPVRQLGNLANGPTRW
jgi:hypothetical protein